MTKGTAIREVANDTLEGELWTGLEELLEAVPMSE